MSHCFKQSCLHPLGVSRICLQILIGHICHFSFFLQSRPIVGSFTLEFLYVEPDAGLSI